MCFLFVLRWHYFFLIYLKKIEMEKCVGTPRFMKNCEMHKQAVGYSYIVRVLCSIQWYTQFGIAALKDVIKAQLLLVLSKIQRTCFRNW